MPTLTALQSTLMTKLVESDYTQFNGNVERLLESNSPHDSATWAQMIIETAQEKGVFTSLLKADLVWHVGEGREALAGLTEKGFEVMKKLYSI